MDLDSFLVSLYVQIEDWWKLKRSLEPPKIGRPALLSDPEVLTLAILAQWPRFRSERDFWRFAWAHLRPYFPMLCSQGQLNRRVRALETELRLLQRAFAEELSEPSALYRVVDTTLIPAIVRVRASRKGLFAGQASFGRSASKTEWVYGFKVALVVDPEGVITAFGLGAAASDERPIGDALIACDRPEKQLPQGVDEGRSALGLWQAPDHRRGHRPTQGLLLSRAPPCQDVGWAADASGRQGRSVHLRTTDQRLPRLTAASSGGPVDLALYTSAVLGFFASLGDCALLQSRS